MQSPGSAFNMHEHIQERAYRLWEQDGRRDGDDWGHWFRAEAEILGATNSPYAASTHAVDPYSLDCDISDRLPQAAG